MLFDTYAWVEFFHSTHKGAKVKELLLIKTCYTSAISLAELVAYCNRLKLDVAECLKLVKENSCVLGLPEALLEKAGEINFEARKSVPDFGLIDSIILATAKTYGLELVTGDKHFQGIDGTVML